MALSTNSGAANKPRVLIAGIAGASLGTELAKSLAQAGRYEIIGCDISPLAFGHYDPTFHRTFVIDHGNYIESVLQLCSREKIEVVVPGAEEVNTVMAAAAARFAAAGLKLAINTPEVIAKFGNKSTTFSELSRLGFRVPKTADCSNPAAFNAMTYPCVVKSTIGSGGNLVFLAGDREEAILRSQYVLRNAAAGVLQEYIDDTEGEFTVAVLSLPDGRLVCSIALQRFFAAKLSVKLRDAAGLISSPYSQGLIDDFPTVREQAERIAVAIGSRGPLDIQGRVKDGTFVPFEINPRFSGSVFLRTLAGFNHVDIFLQYLLSGNFEPPGTINSGYCFRSLSQVFINRDALKS